MSKILGGLLMALSIEALFCGHAPAAEERQLKVVDLGNGVKLEMVWCPPGEFLMGSPEVEEEGASLETQHKVKLTKGFWMGKYEVTQAQWAQVMADKPGQVGGDILRPVETVSWVECQDFLKKLNKRMGVTGFGLPTEAQWEYACRAGSTNSYNTGKDESALQRAGWYQGNSSNQTHRVGQKAPNAWGLYDMHGNVWEWCSDWYGETFSKKGDMTDPVGAEFPYDAGRVSRGGSWDESAADCRSAFRTYFSQDEQDGDLGFRLVLIP